MVEVSNHQDRLRLAGNRVARTIQVKDSGLVSWTGQHRPSDGLEFSGISGEFRLLAIRQRLGV